MRELKDVLVLIGDGIPDSENEVVFISGIEIPDEPLSVRRNFNIATPIGRAKLRKDGDRLYADLELLDEINPIGLYACLGAVIDGKGARGVGSEAVTLITKCRATVIGLCDGGNTDKRIEPIGGDMRVYPRAG